MGLFSILNLQESRRLTYSRWVQKVLVIFGFIIASPSLTYARDSFCAPDVAIPVRLKDASTVKASLRLCGAKSISGTQKLPVVLLFGGFENAARVLDLISPSQPVALATFDYPFEPPRQMEFPASLKFLPEAKAFILRTQEAIPALIDYLEKRPELDRSRISIIGASFGAPFAIHAAATDSRVRGLVVVHGFADVVSTASHRMLPALTRKLGVFAEPVSWIVSSASWWYVAGPEPEIDATKLVVGQKLLMVTAISDSFIPRESTEELWRSFSLSRAEVTRQDLPGAHLLPGASAQISEILKNVEHWMRQKELL